MGSTARQRHNTAKWLRQWEKTGDEAKEVISQKVSNATPRRLSRIWEVMKNF
jgi:hypothetical protein